MRRCVLLVAAVMLLTSCSQTVTGQGQPSKLTPLPTSSRSSSSQPTTPPPPAASPGPRAPIADVIAWVGAGQPADVGGFHTATLDGVSTDLGDDVAFSSASGDAKCTTSKVDDGALACMVKLTNPPPRPADLPSNWVSGWVDFDGQTLTVGSLHGDPGPFINGAGPSLADGQTLTFGDFRCRGDTSGLLCANSAHQSAARLSAAGIEPFGCLRKVTPPQFVGIQFSC
jgi:hypothetical protein